MSRFISQAGLCYVSYQTTHKWVLGLIKDNMKCQDVGFQIFNSFFAVALKKTLQDFGQVEIK